MLKIDEVTREDVRILIADATEQAGILVPAGCWWVRRAAELRRGDYTSNFLLVLGAQQKRAVADLAMQLLPLLESNRFHVEESKGFLNFRMNDDLLKSQIEGAITAGERYGAGQSLAGQRVLVEFVSADPDGPLPFSVGRVAAVGDALCRLLSLQGANVTREYFLNDDESSSKMKLLGESVASHYLTALGQEHEPPEGVLNEAFVRELGQRLAKSDGNAHLLVPDSERAAAFTHVARDEAVALEKQVLNRLGVRFDLWTSDTALNAEGRVESVLKKLQERGYLYERDGAKWLRTTQFGDEADRVLVRSNGRPTYLASDIAYHVFKNERGFDLLLNIWTAEHKPYIERTKAALSAAGCNASKVEVLTCESARLLRDGRPLTRGSNGDDFTLNEALDSIDADTLRFFFVRQSAEERVAIDDEIALRENESNPAYAVRLLPTRLDTAIREAQARGASKPEAYSDEERELARLVALWPDTAQNAALERAPHRVAAYLVDLANATRAVVKASRPDAPAAAIDVLQAAKVAAQNALSALGLSGGRI